jgi:hypothetical protein
VHPIERLRAVARAQGVDQRLLAREAATTLGVLADEPLGLVPSCRRLLDRHPGAGVLWWACARLLDAADVRGEARAIGRDLAHDPVTEALLLDVPERAGVVVVPDPNGGSSLVDALTHERPDVVSLAADDPAFDVPAALDAAGPDEAPPIVVVEAGAAGTTSFLAREGTADAIGRRGERAHPVWLALGPGRRLPTPLFDAAVRLAGGPDHHGFEVVPLAAADRVVEPRRLPCPAPPELLRPWSL